MLKIPNIDPEKVERYAQPFLELTRNARKLYTDMKRDRNEQPLDPNHENVIDISSDDEENFPQFLESDDDEEVDGEGSRFFQPSADVAAFNARRAYTTPH